MPSLGEIKSQLSSLMVSIKAHNFNMEDAMPQEMLAHFHEMSAFTDARAHIKELEAKNEELTNKNGLLQSQLKAKQAEIDYQPAEHRALKVDLQQCELRVEFFKGISEHEQERADRFERKMKEALKSQEAANDDARRIQNLQQALTDGETMAFKLVEENRRLKDHYEAEHDKTLELIKEKEDMCFALRTYANRVEAEKAQADEDSEQVNETLNALIDDLEEQTHSAAAEANSKSALFYSQRDFNDKLFSTIVSKLTPLERFYDHAIEILSIYQAIVKSFLKSDPSDAAFILSSLEQVMISANNQLSAYDSISTDARNEADLEKYGLAQEAAVSRLDGIAQGAKRMRSNWTTFSFELAALHKRQSKEHHAKARSGSGVLTRTLTVGSSHSSISSFTSLKSLFFCSRAG
ncbi:hypothetical protein ACEQ8H_005978 [Pleosporales sp. CAS-2024a]